MKNKSQMMTYADTEEIQKISIELSSIADEAKNKLDSLFLKMQEVPEISKEWVGQKAKFYVDRICNTRQDQLGTLDAVLALAKEIKNQAEEIEAFANRTKRG